MNSPLNTAQQNPNFGSNTADAIGARSEKLGSDAGTVFLHWFTVATMLASIVTGLRISADGLGNTWAEYIQDLLPQGEIWTWHIVSALSLTGAALGYVIYARRGRLGARNAQARLRTLSPPTTNRLRLRAINVALHWFAYGAIVVLAITGSALYLGYAGLFLTLHNALAWMMVAYFLIHTLAHFLYGGITQLLRLFRPRPLAMTPQTAAFPLGLGLISAALGVGLVVFADWSTQPGVKALPISETISLDGRLQEPFWSRSESVSIATHQGANLGGSGRSDVSMRVAFDETKIHFAFQWSDPTRSLMRVPLVKKANGWHALGTNISKADVNDYYEDKFAVLFSHDDGFGGGRSTFLGKDPLPTKAKSPHGRGLHYTDDGRILDLWQWKATRGGMIGHMDDMYFGPPKAPTAKEASGKSRYAAGYKADPGKSIYEYNYTATGPNGYQDPVQIKRLPADLAKLRMALGAIPQNADGNNDEGSQWWLTRETSVPYSPELDAAIPVGTVLPSTLNIHQYEGDRADLAAGAQWQNGKWTLEVSRLRDTGSPYDMTFHSGQRVYVWLSVFDHNQIRHTRHQRAITLDIP